MARPISARLHSVIDFATVPLLLAAGPLFRFDGKPAEITSTLAGAVLVYSVFTWFIRMISLRTHLLIDSAVAVVVIVAPWLFGFVGVASARYFFFAFGLFSLMVVTLTDTSTARTESRS